MGKLLLGDMRTFLTLKVFRSQGHFTLVEIAGTLKRKKPAECRGLKVRVAIFLTVGGINLSPVFTIDKVVGAAGIFTSAQAGQNGFALIADVTQYVKMQDIFVSQGFKMAMMQEEQATIKLDYSSQAPSKAKEDKINSMIYNFHKKRAKLQLR